MRNPVRSFKVKYDGSSQPPWDGDLVDAIGDRWLVVFYERPPQQTSSGEDPRWGLRYAGLDIPLSVLIYFNERGDIIEYHCDAALPAVLHGRDLTFVDLDIDLVVLPDGSWFERDHADFARRRVEMAYPPEVQQAAHQGLSLARQLARSHATPFDGHPSLTLGKVLLWRAPL